MRIYKPRGLNVDESYACNRSAVRKAFEGTDLSVLWGNKRSFSFDSRMRKRPRIDGTVIASLSVNLRNPKRPLEGVLNFYIIADSTYDSAQMKAFECECLPQLKDWYCAFKQLPSPSGCHEILVVWRNNSFSLQEIHFA